MSAFSNPDIWPLTSPATLTNCHCCRCCVFLTRCCCCCCCIFCHNGGLQDTRVGSEEWSLVHGTNPVHHSRPPMILIVLLVMSFVVGVLQLLFLLLIIKFFVTRSSRSDPILSVTALILAAHLWLRTKTHGPISCCRWFVNVALLQSIPLLSYCLHCNCQKLGKDEVLLNRSLVKPGI